MRSNSFIPSHLQKSIYVNFLKGNRAIVHDKHKNNIEEVIRRLDKNNFRINPLKIQFCQNEVKILRMIINGEEKVALSEKKKEIKKKKNRSVSEI
ncbi:putative prtein [Pseudoloma neurophilia]|uniref:Putative prtein n=1 Tax=Pseudoloma neurophilia TaxID=146866 RepID=A0A0R0M7J2_9MICR|nr:putative prtein [Pseudoloma neurophilia]